MRMHVAALAVAALAFVDPPFAGRWKQNPAKSDFGQLTILYEAVAGGYKISMDGASYTIKTDGKEVKTPWGAMQSLKSVNANTLVSVNRLNGKLLSTDTLRISPDGSTLTIDSKVMKADGSSSSDQVVTRRVGQGKGLAGKWQTKNLKSSAPTTLQITATGNGINFRWIDANGGCNAKFDGKPAIVTGPMFDKGWTCTIAKSGTNGFAITFIREGKPMYTSTYTASADGKTLTESGGAIATGEKLRVVYDRQ